MKHYLVQHHVNMKIIIVIEFAQKSKLSEK